MHHPIRSLTLISLTLLMPHWALAQTESSTLTRSLAPGVTHIQEIRTGAEPMILNILKINLKEKGAKVRYGQARDVITLEGETKGRELLPDLLQRQGAVAAINGDFAAYTADPLGVAIRDGELLSEPMDYRVCVGIQGSTVLMDRLMGNGAFQPATGSAITLTGINRVPHAGDIVIWTPTYQAKVQPEKAAVIVTLKEVNLPLKPSQVLQGKIDTVVPYEAWENLPVCAPNTVMIVAVGEAKKALITPCNRNDMVSIRFDLVQSIPVLERGKLPARSRSSRPASLEPVWKEMDQAMGGGPWLVQGGQVAVDWELQRFNLLEFVERKHPRTAIGVMEDGTLLLVVVDGRQERSIGVSLFQLAQLMKNLGAVNAINLDGGGSSTMLVGGGTINSPSDGKLRPLANGLLIYGEVPQIPEAEGYQISPNPKEGLRICVGDTQTFQVVGADGQPIKGDIPIFWGTMEGTYFIPQTGIFKPTRTGTTTVTAFVGGKLLKIPVSVVVKVHF